MSDFPLNEAGLKALRVKTVVEFQDATDKKNDAAIEAARQMLLKIDEALDDLAIQDLKVLADELKGLQGKLDEAKKKTTLLGGIQDLAKPKPPQQPG
jgi:hypothetical protein